MQFRIEGFPGDVSRWMVTRLALFLTVSLHDVVGDEQAETNDDGEDAKHYQGSDHDRSAASWSIENPSDASPSRNHCISTRPGAVCTCSGSLNALGLRCVPSRSHNRAKLR